MKKTKMMVVTAGIVFGAGSSVQAKLPANSIIVGSNVYSAGYLSNPNNLAMVNDQLMNSLGLIYFVDDSGKAKDVFTGSVVEDTQLVQKVGNTLTYYTAVGTMQKIVTDSNNEFTDPTNMNTDTFAIINVSYNPLTTGLNMYNVKITRIEGVSNAAYFKIGDSSITPIKDIVRYFGGATSGGSLLSIYASDGLTEIANGYANIKQNSNIGGEENVSVILTPTAVQDPTDKTTHGNTAINISNNGFAAIDKNNKWIYYQNTGDKDKLYKRSVTGVEDYVISNDSAGFINVVGDWVYYSNYDDNGKIYKIRNDGTQKQKISEDMASSLNVVGDKIYYINNSDRGRIYIIDSQGRRQLISDSAKFLSVGDNFLFYVNTSDGNKLYSYDLLSNRKSKISDINTAFISASGDYLIFYTGKDGKLYRSTNSLMLNPVPIPLITNIPQKGGKGSGDMKGVADTATSICAVDDNNIYYRSHADGGKIYKLDNTGNGYKVVDAPADYINIVGDSLYYTKSGKAYVIPKDSDGTVKGTPIKKPKLNEKVVKVEPFDTFTTSDITKFNFPERVSAIMSDGTIRELVVDWDKSIPKPKKGVYNFTGSILGYGTKVTMSVALDSGTLNAERDVVVTNEIGSKDTVKVTGAAAKLNPGDIINVYNELGDEKPIKTAAVDKNGNALVSGLNLNPDGGVIYVSITRKDKAEGSKITVAVPAEAPTGFSVEAQTEQITGLKPNKQYKVYINDLSTDGSIPDLPLDFISVTSDDKGVITVSGMKSKITSNKDNKQMLRVVAVGNKDSMPSSPIEISKAKVPDYVSIDLMLGRIVGTSAQMQYRYKDSEEWKDCQPGTTGISMTMSLQVQVKVKAVGPVMESDVAKFGLFPMPQINGIENGKIYAVSSFPDVTWSQDNSSSGIKCTATLTKDGSTTNLLSDTNADGKIDGIDLKKKIQDNGNGEYVFTVTATKTDSNMTPSTATNSKSIKFTVNSSVPGKAEVTMTEKPGTKKVSPTDPDTYYQATPGWTDLAGIYSKATLKMTKTASGTDGNVTYTAVANPAEVSFIRGNTITQNGEYELKVITTSKENGAENIVTEIFRVDNINKAVSPDVVGVTEGGVYKDIKTGITITDKANCKTTATIMRDGYTTPYKSGDELTVNGKYVLILNTVNEINGQPLEKKIAFTIEDTGNVSSDVQNVIVNNNPSGDDTIVVNDTIPFGSTIKVYSASGRLMASQTNNGPAGSVTVTIPGGIPASDAYVYVTRTDSGKEESNKKKVDVDLVPSIKSVSPTILKEADTNDGTVSGTIVVEIQNGTVQGNVNGPITVTPTNLPAGLTYSAVKLDDTHIGITISGKATNHTNANDTDELSFAISADQVGGSNTQVLNTGHLTIDFNDQAELKASPTTLTEAASNDGTVTGDIIIEVKNGTFVDPSITDTNTDSTSYVRAANLPSGLHYKMSKVDNTHLKISISGKTTAHENANDVNNLVFTIDKSKIIGTNQDLNTENIIIDFKDKSAISYSANTFSEATTNDGAINNNTPITIVLSGDTLTGNNNEDFVATGKVSVSNCPDGLITKVVRTSSNTLSVTLVNKAANHTSANNVNNLTITFTNSAFTNEPASQIIDSTKSDLKINFTD
ncbi:hypothetical protein BD780_000099 [Clostridium tetanomorphum]|uniref:DUF5050 domain-containing protein n=1 Tax=Clostridium tetanomorphum TaxID=1553 RepID=UPI00044B995C|nr:DUF5050 domain-containing protein [Clostridium tetanomorphum]KAJ52121.1 surface-layer protein [Clostridium tetanomorphum DSM 665]MBP1863045.1 hypothetical protein [Clostridium tetanomorphum]NRS82874.1 hypothetical protein [Clostridium tetanomorphum]SQC03239.1 surface-layer protein [Clostridium tetanomorphum]